jgi:hypothetical protein
MADLGGDFTAADLAAYRERTDGQWDVEAMGTDLMAAIRQAY